MAYFGTLAPYIAPQGGPNGVNHISMYLGYHNIEIKTRDILKLNFGIWNIAGSKPDSVLKWNQHKLPDLIKNDGFEMARLWDFQKYPIFGNLSEYYLFCKV